MLLRNLWFWISHLIPYSVSTIFRSQAIHQLRIANWKTWRTWIHSQIFTICLCFVLDFHTCFNLRLSSLARLSKLWMSWQHARKSPRPPVFLKIWRTFCSFCSSAMCTLSTFLVSSWKTFFSVLLNFVKTFFLRWFQILFHRKVAVAGSSHFPVEYPIRWSLLFKLAPL